MYSGVHLKPQKAPDDLTDKDLIETNESVARMIALVLSHWNVCDSSEVPTSTSKMFCPTQENEWLRLLLMNVFDGCAMTYQGCESQSLSETDGTRSVTGGHICRKFFTGSFFEGIGCAHPKEYSDTDIMNVLLNFKAIESDIDDVTDYDENKIGPKICEENENDKNVEAEKVKLEQNVMSNQSDADPTFNTEELPSGNNDQQVLPRSEDAMKIVQIARTSHPGYVRLLSGENTTELLKIADLLNYGPVIRSSAEEYLLAHEFEYDNAIAVECGNWPTTAIEWESRARVSGWPGTNLITKCRGIPCSIVSKSHASNPNDQYEWRYSFARHEGILMRSLPIKTKMVYIISKVLLKQIVSHTDILTTYHLKTLFLWYCENNNFADHEIEINVRNFIQFIVDHLNAHDIPNYFIPTNNMIAHLSREDMATVRDQISRLLCEPIATLSVLKTAKQYPFSVSGIAKGLTENPSRGSTYHQRLQSNFMSTIIDHIFSLYLPNSNIMWIYVQYVSCLVEHFQDPNTNARLKHLQTTIQTGKKASNIAYQIYGMSFTKLVILCCTLVEIEIPDMCNASRLFLKSSLSLQTDSLSTSSCVADVINITAAQGGVSATEVCCHALKEWVVEEKSGNDIFMLTLKRIMLTLRGVKRGIDMGHLLACLAAVTNILEIPMEGMTVGMAVALRLDCSAMTLENIATFCGIIRDIDTNGVMKHLIYAIVLSVGEAKNETNENSNPVSESIRNESQALHDANKALEAIKAICRCKMFSAGVDTLRFVTAVVVFQKLSLTSQEKALVKNLLRFYKTSNISKDINEVEELVTDIGELMEVENVSIADVFPFVVFYTWKNILSAGFSFTLSVLDELLQPHLNLGVLSAVGTELAATRGLDENIAVIETWIARASVAPVKQNPLLRVKMYGRLGHLYHIKAMLEIEDHKQKILLNKAFTMFKTALKEKPRDISLILDYLLLLWGRNRTHFEMYLAEACSSDDLSGLSTYHENSIPVLSQMKEIKTEIERKGKVSVSSAVFAHYTAICYREIGAEKWKGVDETMDESPDDNNRRHIKDMTKIVDNLKSIVIQMQQAGSECTQEVGIVVDSYMLLGFAANKLKMRSTEIQAFNEILNLCPDHEVAKSKSK